jgi:hypothetical protein
MAVILSSIVIVHVKMYVPAAMDGSPAGAQEATSTIVPSAFTS